MIPKYKTFLKLSTIVFMIHQSPVMYTTLGFSNNILEFYRNTCARIVFPFTQYLEIGFGYAKVDYT